MTKTVYLTFYKFFNNHSLNNWSSLSCSLGVNLTTSLSAIRRLIGSVKMRCKRTPCNANDCVNSCCLISLMNWARCFAAFFVYLWRHMTRLKEEEKRVKITPSRCSQVCEWNVRWKHFSSPCSAIRVLLYVLTFLFRAARMFRAVWSILPFSD